MSTESANDSIPQFHSDNKKEVVKTFAEVTDLPNVPPTGNQPSNFTYDATLPQASNGYFSNSEIFYKQKKTTVLTNSLFIFEIRNLSDQRWNWNYFC